MSTDRTVHVVDDDAAVRRSMERLLDAAGFRVISYESSLVFLEAAAGLSGGCILLDIRMPGMDGLELQARLNRLRIPLPVIVMTGHGDVPGAVRAMKAGAADFLEKPLTTRRFWTASSGHSRRPAVSLAIATRSRPRSAYPR
jgi:two-component system, LuxR family, response regulator FixJ